MSWEIKNVTDLSKKVAKKPWIIYAAAGAALLGLVVLLRGSGGNSTESLSLPAGEDTGGSSGGTDYSYVSEVNEALMAFGTEVTDALAAQSEAVNAVLSGVIQQTDRVSGILEDISEENEDLWDAIHSVSTAVKKSTSASSNLSAAITATENKIASNTGNNSGGTFQHEVGNARWSPEAGGYIDKDTAALVSKDPVWK